MQTDETTTEITAETPSEEASFDFPAFIQFMRGDMLKDLLSNGAHRIWKGDYSVPLLRAVGDVVDELLSRIEPESEG